MRKLLFIVLLFVTLSGCKKDVVPSLSASSIILEEKTYAYVQATLVNDGGSKVLACGFCWDTLPNPTLNNRKSVESLNSDLTINGTLTDLKAGRTYYLNAYATNQAGTGYGIEISFNTSPLEIPIVITGDVTDITKNSASCEIILQSDGGEKVLSQGICYSRTPDPRINDLTVETSGYRSTAKISGLSPNTNYFLRAYAKNSAGVGYGLVKPIKTKAFFKISSIVSDIGISSARCSSTISTDGERPINEWGMCWAATPDPDINNNKAPASSVSSALVFDLTGLTEETTYYLRPYVLAGNGPEYGDVLLFTTKRSGATIKDVNGNSYNIVSIGNQTWMSENLRVTKFRDGSDVTESWAYNNDNANVAAYGRLYTYKVASSGSICPAGWHVPTNSEWSKLGSYLIMNGYNYDGSIPSADPFITGPIKYSENKLAKSLTSAYEWNGSTIYGAAGSEDFPEKRNLSGFNAKPGGMYFLDGRFYFLGSMGIWWSSDVLKYVCAYGMHAVPIECFMSTWFITYDKIEFGAGSLYGGFQTAYSIRCIKD